MNRRGFFFADALVGLFLLSAVAGMLVTTQVAFERFDRRLANQRLALRHAEQAIIALQADRAPSEELHATVSPLPDAAPTGLRWVRVIAVEQGQRGELIGLTKEAR